MLKIIATFAVSYWLSRLIDRPTMLMAVAPRNVSAVLRLPPTSGVSSATGALPDDLEKQTEAILLIGAVLITI